ncbi:hypothetical protein ACH4T9_09805 [Micromonospora sp. NPDC020750]|uniref:hypothetical protein n=1 Tax=unclassified Micromonospora TaxID=2617518 RepID=UPI00379961FB
MDLREPDLTDHCAAGPGWRCEACGEEFPCSTWRGLPLDRHLRGALLSCFTLLLGQAVRDLRGHPDGPTPPQIVRRFLWFMPLSDDEARAVALRVR